MLGNLRLGGQTALGPWRMEKMRASDDVCPSPVRLPEEDSTDKMACQQQTILFLAILEFGKSKIKASAGLCLVRTLLLSHVSSRGARSKGSL